jgi:hypothetical protein
MRPIYFIVTVVAVLTINISFAVSDETCEAPDEWFKPQGTPAVPAEFKVPSNEECNFYKFAWQSFLWLTQSDQADGTPRFVLFKSPNDLFPASGPGSQPLIATGISHDKIKRSLELAVRTAPATSRDITTIAIQQASSHGVLVDQNHRPIFFAQHINDAFEKFVKGTGEHELHIKSPKNIEKIDPATAQRLQSKLRYIHRGSFEAYRLNQTDA